jgi:hypothetical protein
MLLLLEVLWGWSFAAVAAQILSGNRGSGASIVAVSAIVLGAAAFGGLLRQYDAGEARTRALGVASMLIAVAIVIPLDYREGVTSVEGRAGIIGAAVALGALWVRGATRNDPDDLFEPIARSAIIGVAPVAIAAASQPEGNGGGSFGAVAILYIPLALLVLALHQAAEPNKRVQTLAAGWAPFAVLAVGAGAAITLLVVAINPSGAGVLSPVGDALAPVGDAIGRYVLGPIFAGIAWVLSFLPSLPTREQELQPQPEEPPLPPEDEEPSSWGEWLAWAARVLVPLAIVAAILFGIALLFQIVRRRRAEEDDESFDREDESVDDSPGFLASLRGRFGRTRGPSSAVAIRRLYAEMLERAAADGIERAPSVTPLQFAPALDSRYGGAGTEITRAFIASRYGGRDIGDEQVRALRVQWERATQAK